MSIQTFSVYLNEEVLTYEVEVPPAFSVLEVDEETIQSKEQFICLFKRHFHIPDLYCQSLSRLRMYLFNGVTTPTVVVWHNFLLSMEHLDDFPLEMAAVLVEISLHSPNLHVVGIQ